MQPTADGKGFPLRPEKRQTLRQMKLLALLLTAACIQVSAHGNAQLISIAVKKAPLTTVIAQVEKQTVYRFVFTSEQMRTSVPVTLSLTNVPLEKMLDACFDTQPLSYTIRDLVIILQPKPTPVPVPLPDITGRVVSKTGAPVPGATITVKGTRAITLTDANGEFTLTGLAADATLIVSSAEMETVEWKLEGKTTVTIVLAQKVSALDETIVVGYGTTTRRFSVGSVSKVTAEEIARQPVSNPLAALQGRVPGLVVNPTSGIPGAAIKIQIRGQNSINPNPAASKIPPLDNPLFIIDGVPFAPQNTSINQFSSMAAPPSGSVGIYNNPYGGISPFNSINPADIESIEILRDANETAIYGSRGGNGVILITTRKGMPGKAHLGMTVYSGISEVPHSMPLMNTSQYLEMRREAFANDGVLPGTDPAERNYAPDLLIFDPIRQTDWKEYFLGGTAQTTDLNASVSGGTAGTQFLIGSGYHHESYIYPGDFGSTRASVNVNLHHQSPDQRLILDFSANYSYSKNNSSGSENVLKAFTLTPNYLSLLTPGGGLTWSDRGFDLLDNPLAYLKRPYLANSYNLISHFQAAYRILPGLNLRASLGYNDLHGKEVSQLPKSSQPPSSNPLSYANFGINDFQTWIVEPQADFSRSIAQGKLTVVAGATLQQNNNSSSITQASDFPNDGLLGSMSAAGNTRSSDSYSHYKYAGLFGKLGYIWRTRYILSVSGRRDGSSRFGTGKQFGNFGSAGLGWIFSEEEFMRKKLSWLSFGKLRGSMGTTGNDRIGDYQYLSRWANAGNPFEGSVGYQPQNLSNPSFSWSVTKEIEGGLELGFFKDKLIASATWFRNRCGNQLVTFALPTQTGFTGVTANFPALVQNKGWEFQLSVTPVRTSSVQWTSSLNLSIVRNRLVSFPGIAESAYKNTYVVGQSTSVLNKYEYLGVDPATGTFQFTSKNGPTISPSSSIDRHIIGNLDPKCYGGWGNQVRWKNFSVDIFFRFVQQKGANYLQQLYAFIPGGSTVNLPVAALDRWQAPGDIAVFEKYTYRTAGTPAATAAAYFLNSSGSYSDASYIRLQNISLSYQLPATMLKKAGIQDAKVYVNGQNLLTISGYKGNDPETQSFYSLPPLRTIVAGLQFTF